MNHKTTRTANRRIRFEVLESRQMFAAVADTAAITLEHLGTYQTGIFDESAAEIVTYDAGSQRLFVVNGHVDVDPATQGRGGVDVLDIHDPTNPTLESTIDTSPFGQVPTSADVHDGLLAVAVRRDDVVTENGMVAFFDVRGETPKLLGAIEVGAYPDNVIFTPDGSKVLVANEGQPNEAYTIDPEGSVSIITVTGIRQDGVTSAEVTTATFQSYNGQEEELRRSGVRIFGPGASVAQDLEPEYIAVGPNSQYAWVTLQENNAIAKLNIESGQIELVKGLGFKDHSLQGNGLDASDKDHRINIATHPVKGMYQPDAISTFVVGDQVYLATANEGDDRNYAGFSEKKRVKDLGKAGMLSDSLLGEYRHIQDNDELGRLRVTTAPASGKEGDKISELYAFGARSFSIWTSDVEQVYDSGDDFEQITADILPDHFNSNHDDNDSFEKRSDDKGPEPESIVVGTIADRSYAFVGLERIGGIMVYDVTNPARARFVTYFTSRNFRGAAPTHTAGDLSPEGLKFIPADKSPTGEPLLAVANEVSGTTTILRIDAPRTNLAKAELNARPDIGHRTTSNFSVPSETDERAARPGDANHDGYFNQLDIVEVLQADKYLSGRPASFEEGDWNGDTIFDRLDVVAAMAEGNYLTGGSAAHDATLAEYNHQPEEELLSDIASALLS